MSVLDTNYLVSILQGKGISESTVDMIDDPKTTTINAYELYYGARRSDNPEKSLSAVSSLLKSIPILEFDNRAALKAGDIQAELMDIGRPVNLLDALIAGVVITNKEVLLTRNIDHFGRIKGLRCRSW
jgi:predicted nucleic acid-binding protein